MNAMARLGTLWNSIQAWLFPMLDDELGALDDKHREFVAVCETCAAQAQMDAYRWVGNGCPPIRRPGPAIPGRACPQEGVREES